MANRIAKHINGAVLHDLKQADAPDLSGFDCVIIGGSLYAGMLRKEAKTYIAQHADELKGKKLGLFLCGMEGSQEKEYFANNVPADVLQTAVKTAFLGGIFDPKKAGIFERLVIKIIKKKVEYIDIIDDEGIKNFAEALKI